MLSNENQTPETGEAILLLAPEMEWRVAQSRYARFVSLQVGQRALKPELNKQKEQVGHQQA